MSGRDKKSWFMCLPSKVCKKVCPACRSDSNSNFEQVFQVDRKTLNTNSEMRIQKTKNDKETIMAKIDQNSW